MFKKLFKIFSVITIGLIIIIFYLSIFGIKTDKFNNQIKSIIIEKDSRFDLEIKDVFFKLNIKEKSISLNTRDIIFYINKESQKIKNVDLLIDLKSLIKSENKINKIIVNSKKNEIFNLLKFIRAYRINIPALYLENSVKKGNIIYDFVIDFNKTKKNQIEFIGKINDTNLDIFGKEKIQNINLEFKYKNQQLDFTDIEFKYKGIEFNSEKISTIIENDLVLIKGNLKNKINLNLISNFYKNNLDKYIDENILLPSKSDFKIVFNKKIKIKDYELKSKINFDKLNINLQNNNIQKYITNLNNKIILQDGEIELNLNKKNKLELELFSKFTFNENQESKNISLKYSKKKREQYYKFSIDLTESEFFFDQINYNKKKGDKFLLDLFLIQRNNIYILNNLNLSNIESIINLKNIQINKNFKIEDFESLNANFYNKDGFANDVSINKKNNTIEINSKNFDISSNIEKSLKTENNSSIFDIFNNLNSSIIIDIKSAKIDMDHNLKNFGGKIIVKKNKVERANISGEFNSNNKFIYTTNQIDGKKITTIFSDVAKPFVKKFKFIKGFEGGKLDFSSAQIDQDLFKSELRVYDFKLKNMPTLTKLLSLASLQGIADLATGEGIRFNEFDMYFENSKNLIKINEIYALGPAISILMEGYVEKNKLVSLKGTLVPATTINKTIAKIPLLGEILVGSKTGEGVFGVSFKIKGPPDDLDTRVNPIKTLTPRFITRTLDKIKKTN